MAAQTIVIGHVALIQLSKRQDFVLDVIAELRKQGFDAIGIFAGECRETEYTSAKRACHNTWLECLCGNGIVLGSVFVLFILMTLVRGMKDLIRNVQSDSNQLQWSLVISITAVIISLITVDNSTYSYLWFGLSTLMMTSSIS